MPPSTVPTIYQSVMNMRQELRACLLERESAIDSALLALLTKQHMLLLGPPGTGKSLLVRAIQKRIVGAVHFEKLMGQFTVPEEIFGPVDLVRYADQGEYRRITAGSISDAHIVFLDEVFKANSAILNSLLTIMNERLIHEVGMAPQRVPLLSMFGASNELPSDDTLQALDDRFPIREIVEPVHEEDSFLAIVTGTMTDINDVQASITLDELAQAQQDVENLKAHTDTLQAIVQLHERLSAEGVVVSDRRWAKVGRILKARAWLDGQDEVDVETLTCLVHVLWTTPKERKTVERVVYEVACPLHLKALEIEDAAADVFGRLPAESDQNFTSMAENILQQLVDQHTMLKTAIAQSHARNLERAHEVLTRIGSMYRHVTERYQARMAKLDI